MNQIHFWFEGIERRIAGIQGWREKPDLRGIQATGASGSRRELQRR
jgi:hypothetical protein